MSLAATTRAFGQQRCRPPEASARRHRFADIRVTRKRFAISLSLAPASIWSAPAPGGPLGRGAPAFVTPALKIFSASHSEKELLDKKDNK